MKNIFYILLLLSIFAGFSVFIHKEYSQYSVLEVISPREIVIDFNKNGQKDNNETLFINDIESFSTHIDKNENISDKYGISVEDSLRLGFLAEEFAKNFLEGKKIKFKNNQIYINGDNYSEMLLEKGFAIKKDTYITNAVEENLKKAQKLNLVLLNNKSNKFHKLDCEYGQKSKNFVLIPKSQVPKSSTPCKFCHESKTKNKNYVKKFKHTPINLEVKDENIKLFLSDMTQTLKPNNKCKDKICLALLNEINSAKDTIDFAIYGYSKIPIIEKALINAQNRGVKIRFVFDEDNKTNIYPDTYYLTELLKNHNSDNDKAIMHNKFFIFDGETVLTGSANLSKTDMSGFNSNAVVIIKSKDLAKTYTNEFEQMYNGKFHKEKTKTQNLQTENIKALFSPQDDIIINEIIPLINRAKIYIYIPAFIITHSKFSQSLIKAKQRGVDVKIILDATNTRPPSKITELRNAKIPVKTENFAGKLHSKSIIIDDKYLVIGSMNFSTSGAVYNDENVLIIKNENFTKFYRQFFTYLWNSIPDKWLKYSARAESLDSIGSCEDGIDNDYDGDIDLKDSGCKDYIKSK